MQTARTIRVTIDNSGAKKGAAELKSELRGIADAARTSAKGQSELAKAANDNGKALSSVAREADGAGRSMDKLNGIVKTFLGLAAAKKVIDLADAYTRFTNSLRVAGVEGTQQQIVISKLYASAQKYGVQLEAMGSLYGKASQAQKSLNASQADLIKFSTGVAAALKVQGGSVTDAAGALHQLGQAITGNKIQAEEYNSILDGAYPILQAVAAGSDKYKGSVANLTAAVKAGKVTSKEFFDDFLKGSSFLEQRAAKSNFTVAASYQVLENAMIKYIGEVDQANLATATLGGTMRAIAGNLDTIVPAITTLGIALGVGFVTRAAAASLAATGATTMMGAMGVAARSAGASLLSAFGGPVGIALTGLTLGMVALYNQSQTLDAGLETVSQAADKLKARIGEAGAAAKGAAAETAGVGTSAAGAEPAIWSFANASGKLTKQLWEQAKAARAARLEMINAEITKVEGAQRAGQDATGRGINTNAREFRRNLGNGDLLAALPYAGRAITGHLGNLASNGRTGRQGQEIVDKSKPVLDMLKMQKAIAEGAPLGPKDVPSGVGPTAAAAGPGKKDKGGKDSVASEAERKAKAQADFWKGLEKEAELSKLTTQQAEQRRREMEIEELTGRKIKDIDAERVKLGKETVAQLIQQREANQFITQAKEQNRTAEIDYQTANAAYQLKLKGMTDEQIAVEKAALEFQATIKKSNLELSKDDLDTLTEQVRKRAQENAELEKRNKLLDTGLQAAEKYSATFAGQKQSQGFADERAGLEALYNNGQNPKFTKAMFDEAIKGLDQAIVEVARAGQIAMQNHWGSAISDLGDQIGGKWGAAFNKIGAAIQNMVRATQGDFAGGGVLGSIASLLGKTVGPGGKIMNNGFGDAVQSGAGNFNDQLFGNKDKGIKSALSDPLKSLSSSVNSFKSAFDPKAGGSLIKGLGSALGGAMQGAQMGSQIAGIGKMFWGKFSSTGSQLGGAIGSVGGPIGSAIGSLIGGIAGGLLKKTKKGYANDIKIAADGSADYSIAGNSSSRKKAAGGLADSFVDNLNDIADSLGATLSSSVNLGSIGMKKDKYTFDPTAGTSAGREEFESQEEAIAAAVKNALEKGVLTGISEFSMKVIKDGADQKALNLASSYENVLKALAKFNSPIKAAVEEAVGDLDTLAKQMKAAGASTSDLAKVEELRNIRLKATEDSLLSGFQDSLKLLRGDASGKSEFALFKEEMGQLQGYRSTIASGGTVDSDKFNSLVQSIVSRAGDLYGTQTQQYQSVIGSLGSDVEQAMANTKSEYEKAAAATKQVYDATTEQTTVLGGKMDTTNDLLANIRDILGGNYSGGAGTGGARNGQLLNAN